MAVTGGDADSILCIERLALGKWTTVGLAEWVADGRRGLGSVGEYDRCNWGDFHYNGVFVGFVVVCLEGSQVDMGGLA